MLKRSLQGFLGVGILFMLSLQASAQAYKSSSSNVSVTIVTELSLSKIIDLKLGYLNVDTLKSAPTEKLHSDKNSSENKLNNPEKQEIVQASFILTGAESYVYAVTLPATATAVNKKGEPIKIDTYLTSKGNKTLLKSDSTVTMGGKLRLTAKQSKGMYVLVGGINLAVNYN